jgi:hypothetical protein
VRRWLHVQVATRAAELPNSLLHHQAIYNPIVQQPIRSWNGDRAVRHANLIAIHGAFFLCTSAKCQDSESAYTLVIVMGLADGSLDRWKEARMAGLNAKGDDR